jgi:hypothetical protein
VFTARNKSTAVGYYFVLIFKVFYAKALGHYWTSIAFAQLVVTAIFILKESWPQAGLLGVACFATLISAKWLRCKNDFELLRTSTEPKEDNVVSDGASFVHPCLNELSGVWVEGLEEQENVIVEAGLEIEVEPRVLEVGGGKNPDVLNPSFVGSGV